MVELTKERVVWAGTALVVMIGMAAYFFLYNPLLKKIYLRHAESQSVEDEAAIARKNVALLARGAKEIRLIAPGQVSAAIEELTRRGKKEDMNFISITPRPIQKSEGPFQILPIELETESSYEALGSFLGALDELEKSLMTVRGFEAVPDPKNGSKIRAQVTIHLYVRGRGVSDPSS